MKRLFAKAGTTVLVVKEQTDGVFLYEYRKDGFIGDTWHQTIDHAKEQAQISFRAAPSDWSDIPATVIDSATFALQISN